MAESRSVGMRRSGREKGKATGSSNANGRITLRNYLDMSKSLNIEPGMASMEESSVGLPRPQQQHSISRYQKGRLDMSKSLNVDSGFSCSRKGVAAAPCAPNSQAVAETRSAKVSARSSFSQPSSERLSNASAADALGFKNMRVLPTSPNLVDSVQEKQLIAAFVEQLKSIATSSSSSSSVVAEEQDEKQLLKSRRRANVRRALDFNKPGSVGTLENAASRAHHNRRVVVEVCPAVANSCRGLAEESARRVVIVGERPQHQRQQRPLEQRRSIDQEHRRHHHHLPRIEEKQTVISSPISYATAISSSKTRIKSADMAQAMQEHAIDCAFQLLKTMDKLNCKLVAWQLKKEFDKIYGPAWHCIVGTSFGSYVTHSVGGFIYFAVGKVSILLFRTAIQVVPK